MTPVWTAFWWGVGCGVFGTSVLIAIGVSVCMFSSMLSRDEERVAENEVARRLLEGGL